MQKQNYSKLEVKNMSYKLMAFRAEPRMFNSIKIDGYLETFYLPTTIPDIIQVLGKKYGGGKYHIRIVDDQGNYVKQKSFDITGPPKIPCAGKIPCNCPLDQILSNGCQDKNHV